MAPRKKNPAIKSSGATSSKASPLPDWVKNKDVAKPPPSYTKEGRQGAKTGQSGAERSQGSRGSGNGDAHSNGSATASSNTTIVAAEFPNGERERDPPVHLFPPGSKAPLNLLYEKIQKLNKEGWEKPSIEVRKLPPHVVATWVGANTKLQKNKETAKGNESTKRGKAKEEGEDPSLEGADQVDEATLNATLGVEAGKVLPINSPFTVLSSSTSAVPDSVASAYTATVILRKINKQNLSEPFTVRMTPNDERLHPELKVFAETALHAKHWVATYALFRLYSNLPMHRILPAGPREYWLHLSAFKDKHSSSGSSKYSSGKPSSNQASGSSALGASDPSNNTAKRSPRDIDFLWSEDPFEAQAKRDAARSEREKARAQHNAVRQAIERGDHETAASLAAASAGGGNGVHAGKGKMSQIWADAKELYLPARLRELIESTVKKGFEMFPLAAVAAAGTPSPVASRTSTPDVRAKNGQPDPAATEAEPDAGLLSELQKLGFRKGYALSAARWVANARLRLASGSFAALENAPAALLAAVATQSDIDAALEYLLVYTPEEDLPPGFNAKANGQARREEFVTSITSGDGGGTNAGDLNLRWMLDRLVKMVGLPRNAVESVAKSMQDAEKDTDLQARWPKAWRQAILLDMLLRRLAGWDNQSAVGSNGPWSAHGVMDATYAMVRSTKEDTEERRQLLLDEKVAVQAILGDERVVAVKESEWPTPVAGDDVIGMDLYRPFDISILTGKSMDDIRMRVVFHPASRYPASWKEGDNDNIPLPTFFIISRTLPVFLRLALTKALYEGFRGPNARGDLLEAMQTGQGNVILLLVEMLEQISASMIDQPPPLNEVMAGLLPRKPVPAVDDGIASTTETLRMQKKKPLQGRPAHMRHSTIAKNPKVDTLLLKQQEQWRSSVGYQPFREVRESLPAWAFRHRLLDVLGTDRVVIVAGETGCGKTTQCPQFILDQCIEEGKGSECNIIVTQPRRVSAMGVAARVAAERGEKLDSSSSVLGVVGYAIRGERKASRECRLLFTTTGVLLRRLSSGGDRDLRDITHIMVDEVHERSVDSDFLLLELREVLKRNTRIKIILMSATIQQDSFACYFGGAPCLNIPGRTFPVQDFYLEDVIKFSGYRPDGGRRGRTENVTEEQKHGMRASLLDSALQEGEIRAVEQISRQEWTDYDLIGACARMVVDRAELEEAQGKSQKGVGGAILVFCSGFGEIRQAMDAIKSHVRGRINVLPLHANLSPQEQRKVFEPQDKTRRKIVVATNVAETSITIPEISYVIDTGKVKEQRFDAQSGLSRLLEVWASRAACKQRRGRAGRTREGECFKLFSRFTEERKMALQQTPEIRRVPLENLFLQVKAMREDEDVKAYLLRALDPPEVTAMEAALKNLIEAGAMQPSEAFRGKLTPLGLHLSRLPLDLRLGKILILGGVLGCLSPALTIAAMMSGKPLFTAPFEEREKASKARAKFSGGTSSDFLCNTNAFEAWRKLRGEGAPASAVRSFCEENYISQSALREVLSNRSDLAQHLHEIGFIPRDVVAAITDIRGPATEWDIHADNQELIKSVIAAGLWPSVVRIAMPNAKFDQGIAGTIQRDHEAKAVKFFDASGDLGRIFLHPASTLFAATEFKSSYLSVFQKSASGGQNKVFAREANEAPLLGLLLLSAGQVVFDHFKGGLEVKSSAHGSVTYVRVRADARIGVLCNQLRRLLDAVLDDAIEQPGRLLSSHSQTILNTVAAVLQQ
ncbi:P-loop containing nucleoside triphosphate hydrolase protein [Tilletiaria anomala UBC 951]|uniref:p-loop containing nucleoside triphosphate hydrolase protein n=1 Tax=Tilletiaria anomala (strain ATCC 24038 / CBS 436.72 / UBC 951) TaxID=1037660 RepID=A0A066WK23_TILAU|nr:P-loop containing nucleoside triphosphate hydrolase protein [Tilletiaria anomala UBC 951]KDN52913.1 P-loop containing nucleoside triphosphate hydrolase protein [Tilletiaria anomala UBC 951]